MPSLANITLQLAHQSNTTTLYQDFEIQLDSNLLLQLMTSYNIKASDVTGDYLFNSRVFEQFVKTEPYSGGNSILKNTSHAISRWPQKLSWSQLNQQINNFLIAWLNDYKLGANLDAAFLLVRCLELKSSKNTQFQSLLIHLVARATNQLEQYKFSYVQNFDLDTNLPNQHLLLNLINLSLSNNQQSDLSKPTNPEKSTHLGLILVNLNYSEVSQLNSTSSSLMLAAMHTIQQHLNDDATLFHLGAIDLAILINPLKSPTQLNLIAIKLLHAFEAALPLENVTLILKPHFGAISTFNIQTNAISLYECAKLALNQAIVKNEPIKFYDQNISSTFMNSQLLDEAIIEALQKNELSLFLQPIVTINGKAFPDKFNTNKINTREQCTNAEMLLRWPSQKWQSVSPARLLDVIYKKGFGRVFIRWLINNTCQHCAELSSTYQHDVSLTINLSSLDLLDSDLPELLSQSITLWSISANSLTIEITESDILVDEVKVLQVLNQIVQLGCKVALDDFGTGYSSMTRLRNMPINIVKIDQSFVRNISSSTQDQAIVKSIIKLAHSLDKEVIAEGVEDLACLNILKEMNCEKIQGYYYGKPMPFEEFITWLGAFKTQQAHLSSKKPP
jgi:EAL domain-containing protein (putative c-di-GMP-specific phosphodiesterase class I)